MHVLSQWANRILAICDQNSLIVSPTGKLLRMALLFYAAATVLFAFAFTPWVIAALPCLAFEGYFYYFFCKVWRSYRFSAVYLAAIPILALLTAMGIHQWIL
ncbi:MAG: hypothetical protein E7651_01985 [Ruminococcaceae bacterium]|nr:hypothetical protein [Oscillospiraceae bacterium]